MRGGGAIVAGETPEDVAKVKESYTGKYLRDLLARRPAPSGRLAGADAGGHPKRKQEAESEGATKKSKKLAAE